MDDTELVDSFEACTLPMAAMRHPEHVQLAWAMLRRAPHFEQAALRFCSGLRRYASTHGKGALYHETITWAYLALVNERMHTCAAATFDDFSAQNRDLLEGALGALHRHYGPDILRSELARCAFLLPRGEAR